MVNLDTFTALLSNGSLQEHLSRGLIESDWESVRNLAAVLFLLETNRGQEDAQMQIVSVEEWSREPAQSELLRTFAEGLMRVLLSARWQGSEMPGMDLEEIKSKLMERLKAWTRQEDLAVVRGFVVQRLEGRFGALPEGAQKRLEAIGSLEALAKLLALVPQANSLATLGLA